MVNVPITDDDIIRTVSSLPRTPKEAGIIAVDLKRRECMKSSVLKQYIDVHKLGPALVRLKECGHPSYQFINSAADYLHKVLEDDLDEESNEKLNSSSPAQENMENCSSDSKDEEDYLQNDAVRKNQIDLSECVCMTQTAPEASLVSNYSDRNISKRTSRSSEKSFSIAPGESKIPTSLLRDTNWDVNAFPCLYPSGKYGLHYHRPQKISVQQYIKQRLWNCDTRFSKNTSIVFAFLYLIEKMQLEQRISIS